MESPPHFRRTHLAAALAALALGLAYAFIPTEEFIHRGDDAFYYFKVAAQYPELGFWSFDGSIGTNGVQPLWATLLSGVALALSWVGITAPETLARVFVVLTVLVHLASVAVVYGVVSRVVSRGTGVVVAGAMVLPLGSMWIRTWGMESPLYILLTALSVAYFLFRFRHEASLRQAIALGVLLGLTGLARLNAWLLVPCMLIPFILLGPAPGGALRRLRQAFVAGATALVVVSPYVATNLATTGHILPVSGAVKLVRTQSFMESEEVESRYSGRFVAAAAERWKEPMEALVTTRVLDAYWPLGARVVEDEQVHAYPMAAFVLLTLLLPFATGAPRRYVATFRERVGRLGPLAFVGVFAVLDAALSIWLYPGEVYSLLRWWLVVLELTVVVAAATVVTAAIAHASRRVPPRPARRLAVAAIALLFAAHAYTFATFYFDGEVEHPDWTLSWNDAPYTAAEWMAENLPEDALVGVWNAGVMGYYARQPVVNLDGLINDFGFHHYLSQDRVHDYVIERGIQYLCDLDMMFDLTGIHERLDLTEVYSAPIRSWRGREYKIYRVDGVQPAWLAETGG